jgi:hypothetical protein
MPNVIIVTLEELESLVHAAVDRDGLTRADEIKWNKKLDESKEPNFLGYSEDGMCLYELRFTL